MSRGEEASSCVRLFLSHGHILRILNNYQNSPLNTDCQLCLPTYLRHLGACNIQENSSIWYEHEWHTFKYLTTCSQSLGQTVLFLLPINPALSSVQDLITFTWAFQSLHISALIIIFPAQTLIHLNTPLFIALTT